MKKVFFIALLALSACGTQPQLSEIVNDMVVVTNYDQTLDFSKYSTYSMTMDTVGFVSNTSNSNALSNSYTKQITAQIKLNLDKTHHAQVPVGATADIGVNIVIYNNLSISQTYYPGYGGYGGYGGYYGGYYGGGGYGGGFIQTNFDQQAILSIQFYDIKTGQSANAPVIWEAQIGDLVNSYDTSTKTKEAIDQAFVQSPFLKL